MKFELKYEQNQKAKTKKTVINKASTNRFDPNYEKVIVHFGKMNKIYIIIFFSMTQILSVGVAGSRSQLHKKILLHSKKLFQFTWSYRLSRRSFITL